LNTQTIERVDGIPLIVHWLLKMHIPEQIDAIWQPHSHWEGLSCGQLVVLFLTFIIYTHTHKQLRIPHLSGKGLSSSDP